MKVTKYEHACLVVEDGGKRLVIDPGSFVKSLPKSLDKVSAIVITHVHQDHFDLAQIENILEHNPEAKIFCTEEVAKELDGKHAKAVTGGDSAEAGPFKLRFFGSQHAVIHDSWPTNQNVGVLVNDSFYYPGDSFTKPGVKVALLALPVSAPWLKLAEVMDYVNAIKPTTAFPTHNALLSDIGQGMMEQMLGGVAQGNGGTLKPLKTGESIEI